MPLAYHLFCFMCRLTLILSIYYISFCLILVSRILLFSHILNSDLFFSNILFSPFQDHQVLGTLFMGLLILRLCSRILLNSHINLQFKLDLTIHGDVEANPGPPKTIVGERHR
ncbi:hypothetical protein GEMRC1_002774 [Eukaryota sp. GEM-RC1]